MIFAVRIKYVRLLYIEIAGVKDNLAAGKGEDCSPVQQSHKQMRQR
jgi:hypothetical protein